MNQRDMKALVNKLLDEERTQHGLSSDRELAEHLDVTPKTVSRWRSGESLTLSTATLLALAVKHQPPR